MGMIMADLIFSYLLLLFICPFISAAWLSSSRTAFQSMYTKNRNLSGVRWWEFTEITLHKSMLYFYAARQACAQVRVNKKVKEYRLTTKQKEHITNAYGKRTDGINTVFEFLSFLDKTYNIEVLIHPYVPDIRCTAMYFISHEIKGYSEYAYTDINDVINNMIPQLIKLTTKNDTSKSIN